MGPMFVSEAEANAHGIGGIGIQDQKARAARHKLAGRVPV